MTLFINGKTYEADELIAYHKRLEKENAELKYQLNKNPCVKIPEWHCSDCLKENAELKEQNINLQEMLKTERSVTCKEEYLKKVTELEQENAELKETVNKMNNVITETFSNLTKAKKIIRTLAGDLSMYSGDYQKELLEAEQFLNSEVEK